MDKKRSDWAHILTGVLFLVALILLGLLMGCAGTLEKSISTCFVHAGKPAYTVDGTFTKFECK